MPYRTKISLWLLLSQQKEKIRFMFSSLPFLKLFNVRVVLRQFIVVDFNNCDEKKWEKTILRLHVQNLDMNDFFYFPLASLSLCLAIILDFINFRQNVL